MGRMEMRSESTHRTVCMRMFDKPCANTHLRLIMVPSLASLFFPISLFPTDLTSHTTAPTQTSTNEQERARTCPSDGHFQFH